jgi:hypothetical protein
MTYCALPGQLAAGKRERFVDGLRDTARLHVRLLAPWILFLRLRFPVSCFHSLSQSTGRKVTRTPEPAAPEFHARGWSVSSLHAKR